MGPLELSSDRLSKIQIKMSTPINKPLVVPDAPRKPPAVSRITPSTVYGNVRRRLKFDEQKG